MLKPKFCDWELAPHLRSTASIEPQFGDVTRVGLELAFFDPLDEIDQHRIGPAGQADFLTLAHDQTVKEFDLGAPALLHVLTHRRALTGRRARRILKALRVAGLDRRVVAFAGARNGFRRKVQDLLELIAERLADADRFGAKSSREATDRIVLEHFAAGKPGAGGQSVLHRVGDELGPALPPEIAGHFGAVGKRYQPAHFFGARGDAAMDLAGPKHGVRRAVLGGAAMNKPRLRQIDGDARGDAAKRLAPTDDAGDGRLVDAILQ